MPSCDTLIRQAKVLDGSGAEGEILEIALGARLEPSAGTQIDARGLVLAPGFIDVHTHDDISVIRDPEMIAKLSQGVTTVIVGNCGISASPVELAGELPDPMNLLGTPEE